MNMVNDFNGLLVNLREEFVKAQTLGIVSLELYQQQVTQLLMSCNNIKLKAHSEMERLQSLIGECKGQIKAAEMMGSILVETIAAYNRQTVKQQEAEAAQEIERLERELAKQEALGIQQAMSQDEDQTGRRGPKKSKNGGNK
jgi:hypothetical protein